MPSCSHCSKPNATSVCSSCKSVRYCDVTCQKNDWIQHKHECKTLAQNMHNKIKTYIIKEPQQDKPKDDKSDKIEDANQDDKGKNIDNQENVKDNDKVVDEKEKEKTFTQPKMYFFIEEIKEEIGDELFTQDTETETTYEEEEHESCDSDIEPEEKQQKHEFPGFDIQLILVWILELICTLFNFNTPEVDFTNHPETPVVPIKKGPIIIEYDYDYNCDSEESEYESDDFECTHIKTSNIQTQPEFYYKHFLRKFKWRNPIKYVHLDTHYSNIFKAKYICFDEWKQFVHFCKRLGFSIAKNNDVSRLIYDILVGNRDRLEWYEKYIYRWHREKKRKRRGYTREEMNEIIYNGRSNANIITLKLIQLITIFPTLIRQNIGDIFEHAPFWFDNPSTCNDFIVSFLMQDSEFYMYFRVLNWISNKIMFVLMKYCLEFQIDNNLVQNCQYGVLPDKIFWRDDATNEHRIGWVKVSKYYYRFFEIDKYDNNLQIKYICPLGWQPYYIGEYGLDTIMFKYIRRKNKVIWENDAGILLYKQELLLEMDGMRVGKFDNDDDDDDLFYVYGLRYDGIEPRYVINEPSFSSGKYQNLGYMYFRDKHNIFSHALKKLERKQLGEFVFVPFIIHNKSREYNDEFNETLIAYLVLEHCYKKYVNDGKENCYEYKLLVAEIYNNENIISSDGIKEMNCLKKKEKIKKYFEPLIKRRKKEVYEKGIKKKIIGKIKEKRKRKNKIKSVNKKESIIGDKVNEYMNEWIGKRKIKYRHYLNMVNDLGQHLNFDENIKTIKTKGSHSAIHFKKGYGAIPLIPRPHAKQGVSVSLFIVKKWLKTFISKDK